MVWCGWVVYRKWRGVREERIVRTRLQNTFFDDDDVDGDEVYDVDGDSDDGVDGGGDWSIDLMVRARSVR